MPTAPKWSSMAALVRPDVVLMDVRMPVTSGPDATRDLLASQPASRVVMLTGSVSASVVAESAQAGAVGFLVKGDDPEPADRRGADRRGRRHRLADARSGSTVCRNCRASSRTMLTECADSAAGSAQLPVTGRRRCATKSSVA